MAHHQHVEEQPLHLLEEKAELAAGQHFAIGLKACATLVQVLEKRPAA